MVDIMYVSHRKEIDEESRSSIALKIEALMSLMMEKMRLAPFKS